MPIGDDAAPEAIILPGAGGAVMSLEGTKFLTCAGTTTRSSAMLW